MIAERSFLVEAGQEQDQRGAGQGGQEERHAPEIAQHRPVGGQVVAGPQPGQFPDRDREVQHAEPADESAEPAGGEQVPEDGGHLRPHHDVVIETGPRREHQEHAGDPERVGLHPRS